MNNDTPVFTVFGGAYVPEHHGGACIDFDAPANSERGNGPVWLVVSTLAVALTFCAAEIAFFARLGGGLM